MSLYRIRPSKVTVLVSDVRAKYNISLKTNLYPMLDLDPVSLSYIHIPLLTCISIKELLVNYSPKGEVKFVITNNHGVAFSLRFYIHVAHCPPFISGRFFFQSWLTRSFSVISLILKQLCLEFT